MKNAFQYLNIPVALNKLIGPTTTLIYLGILIDTSDLTMQLPAEKLADLSTLLRDFLNKRKCSKKDLLSLIGKLSFATKIIRPGRIFLRRLIDLSTKARKLHHRLDINTEARADIKWWHDNLKHLNRRTLIPEPFLTNAEHIQLFTDASALIGFGAIYNHEWIQAKWSENTTSLLPDIADKELFAIIAACATWGKHWKGKRIVIGTDNEAITSVWDKGGSKSKTLMALTRKLYSLCAEHQFTVLLKHIPGKYNPIADALSRFQMEKFQQLLPEADKQPLTIPTLAWDINSAY